MQTETQIVSQGEGVLWEKKGKWLYEKRKEIPIGADKLSYSLATCGWLIISWERVSKINSPCGQDASFPVGFTKNCL